MTSELLPCPFCGEQPEVYPKRPEIEGDAFGQVRCENEACPANPVVNDGCDVSDYRGSDAYKTLAITAWNTRAEADQIMGVDGAIKVGDEVAHTMAGGSSVVVVEGPEPIWKVQWFDGSTSWVREAQLLLKGPTHD